VLTAALVPLLKGVNDMTNSLPDGAARITPMLTYNDAHKAIEFLCTAFGFVETLRLDMPDGRIGHAELSYDGGVIMLASAFPDMGLMSPAEFEGRYSQLYIYVDDVDAHYAHACAEGAEIITPPQDQFYGDRRYHAADPEGHQWFFATKVRDVPAEELKIPED